MERSEGKPRTRGRGAHPGVALGSDEVLVVATAQQAKGSTENVKVRSVWTRLK